MEYILSLYPFVEISILGDFNVHHQLWLSSSFTDHLGKLAFNFAILHELQQLVQHSTHIPDHRDTLNISTFSLSLILLLILLPYLLHWVSLITFLYSYPYLALFPPIPPQNPPKPEMPLAFCFCQLGATREGIMLIFSGIITVSMLEIHFLVMSA